jgi:hypothetical protein
MRLTRHPARILLAATLAFFAACEREHASSNATSPTPVSSTPFVSPPALSLLSPAKCDVGSAASEAYWSGRPLTAELEVTVDREGLVEEAKIASFGPKNHPLAERFAREAAQCFLAAKFEAPPTHPYSFRLSVNSRSHSNPSPS